MLALRVSYGVGKESGYGSFADPSAARLRQLLCASAVNGEGHPQILWTKHSVSQENTEKHGGFDTFFLPEPPLASSPRLLPDGSQIATNLGGISVQSKSNEVTNYGKNVF